MAGSDTLSAIRRRGVHVLLACRTAEEAATSVGVSVRTVRRWQADPVFREALRVEARSASRSAVDSLLAGQVAAVRVLVHALDDEQVSVRIRAAGLLLDAGQRAADDDLAERVEALEGRAERWATGGFRVV